MSGLEAAGALRRSAGRAGPGRETCRGEVRCGKGTGRGPSQTSQWQADLVSARPGTGRPLQPRREASQPRRAKSGYTEVYLGSKDKAVLAERSIVSLCLQSKSRTGAVELYFGRFYFSRKTLHEVVKLRVLKFCICFRRLTGPVPAPRVPPGPRPFASTRGRGWGPREG